MRRFYVAGFALLAVFDTTTQLAFKLSAQRTGEFAASAVWLRAAALSPWVYVAIAGYLGAFVTWMTLLEHAPVGPAFAASHVDVVTVLVASAVLFGERLTPARAAGAALILAGIALLGKREGTPASAPAGPQASTPAP